MIDTLNFRIHHTHFDRAKLISVFGKDGFKVKSHTFYPVYESWVVGYGNFTFVLGDVYLSAYGSLTKLHYGNNLQQLTFN